jgi:hypothetical protein
MPSRRPTKHPQGVFTCTKYGAAWQRLNRHVEFDQATQRYRAVARCRCGGDKVWLSKAMPGFLEADCARPASLGVESRMNAHRGVPIFPEEGRPGLFLSRADAWR